MSGKDHQNFNPIEAKLHMVMDKLSNSESVTIDDQWIEDAAEEFKSALRKQLKPDSREFKLRMSNIGRPLCQLQNEKNDEPRSRNEYNHILRMIIGDATEIAVNVVMKAAGIEYESKGKHELTVGTRTINGEDDVTIGGKVYDIKSASPYAFAHKWNDGWNGVYYGDTFGYVAQLWGYADRVPEKMGGWIVVDKSSGEIRVVDAKPTIDQLNELEKGVSATVKTIDTNGPFQKVFQEEVETYYKKETGNTIIPTVCSFCSYKGKCWPDAKFELRIGAKPKWYVNKRNERG